FDSLGDEEMLVGVLMCDDGGSLGIQPCVAVSMVEVPVGVDEVPDRIAAEAVGRLEDSWARCRNPSIDEDLAVAAGQDRDVAAGAVEVAEGAGQLITLMGLLGGSVRNKKNNGAGFGRGWGGDNPPAGSCEGGRSRTAETETSTR